MVLSNHVHKWIFVNTFILKKVISLDSCHLYLAFNFRYLSSNIEIIEHHICILTALDTDGEKRKFRPIGINTPETGERNGRPEPFHQQATDFTKAMLLNQSVRIVYDVTELDKYGRHLVYVYLKDGTFFNLEIVRAGWARTMTIAPNVKYAELFADAQREAREQGRGSWE